MTTMGPIGLGGMAAIYFELAELQDELRKTARDARRDAQQAQIDDLLDQADHTERAAQIAGYATIAGAAATGASGTIGVFGATGALTRGTAEASQTLAQSGGKLTDGLGELCGGRHTAEAMRADARSQAHAMVASDASNVEQEARASEEKILRQLETAQGLVNEARSTAIRA